MRDASAERKAFFSEEKKQKTFMSLSQLCPQTCAENTKVFWFFFSKKNVFLSLVLPRTGVALLAFC